MFTIGQFSRLCNLKISTLRVYEKLGIITPAKVEDSNRYRYYSQEQLNLVRSILFMKDLGLPLNKIKDIVSQNPDGDEMILILEEYKGLLVEKIEVLKERLEKVSAWQKDILDKDINAFLEELDRQIKASVTAGPKMLFDYDPQETVYYIWNEKESDDHGG